MDFPDDWYLIHAAEHPLELRYLDESKVAAEIERISAKWIAETRENERLRAERAWQAIETAPKDGTDILVCGRYDDPHKACWLNGRWVSMGCDGPAISSQSDFGTDYQESSSPSHWQSLPTPPVKEGA